MILYNKLPLDLTLNLYAPASPDVVTLVDFRRKYTDISLETISPKCRILVQNPRT